MIVTTASLVINSRKFRESSKLITLFTKEYGKISVVANGARKRKSAFGSSLETMNLLTATIYKNPNRDLHTISKAEADNHYRHLYTDINKLTFGLMIMESLYQSLEKNIPFPGLFDNLKNLLLKLDRQESDPLRLFAASQILIASDLGFSPDFGINGFGDRTLFSYENGNFIDSSLARNGNTFRFDPDCVKYLNSVNEGVEILYPENESNGKIRNQIVNFFIRYFSFHLEKKFTYRAYKLFAAGLV